MNILFIAPLPPPTTGHSVAAKVFLDEVRRTHQTETVNLSVGSRHDGTVTARRAIVVAKILWDVWRKKGATDAIYLTISESVAGNIKDLLIYLLCMRRLSRLYLHLHGGSIKRLLFDRHRLLRRANAAFIRHVAGVIVSGESHVDIFTDMIDRGRIHIVANCAQDHLFVPDHVVFDKFANTRPLRILYMSGMTDMKGFNKLADAYLSLSRASREMLTVDFAGMFESDAQRRTFLGKIAGIDGIRYLGMVDEAQKQQLFAQAHIFCLPTSMLEGQPISILEAYASGCVVLTTGQAGIRDVFKDGLNGFEIDKGSAKSIADILETLIGDTARLLPIAMRNRRLADNQYTTARFNRTLRTIVEGVVV